MPHAVTTIADSACEATDRFQKEAPDQRILRVKEVDFSGLPPLRSGPHPRHWILVVEHPDPEIESRFDQDDHPAKAERSVRQMYLKMALDPDLLSVGVREGFTCPACETQVMMNLPPDRERKQPFNSQCPGCNEPIRRLAFNRWERIERSSPVYPLCVFCGEKANSREHVIPAWIARRLQINDVFAPETAFIAGGQRPKRPFSFANHRARVFCPVCNWHFKHLEDEVSPIVTPLARGVAIALESSSQDLLALWSSKTAVAIAAAEGHSNEISDSQKDAIRARSRAPDSFWVRWFSWNGGPVLAVSPFEGQSSGFAVFLAFGKVGFIVTALSNDVAIAPSERSLFPVNQIHPQNQASLFWPTPPMHSGNLILQMLTEIPRATFESTVTAAS